MGSTLLRCAVCGGKIYGSRFMSKKKEDGYFYRYICRGVNGNCNSPTKYWDIEKVDWGIRDLFRTLFGDKEKLFEYIQKEPGILTEDTSEFLKERDALTNKVAHIDRAVKKQQVAFESDAITIFEFTSLLSKYRGCTDLGKQFLFQGLLTG